MELQILKGEMLKKMFYGGAVLLKEEKEGINALNVFPVPDGDTGTNMFLTLNYAVEQLGSLNDKAIYEVAESMANSSLVGARGNSGVILSQLFRGFSQALEGKQEINVREFLFALQEGVRTAYKAVMKPVEGTMLTVAREAAEKVAKEDLRDLDFISFLEKFNQEAWIALEKTPQLLPVLKESGVVDAGGKGLCLIYQGFLMALKGHEFTLVKAGVEDEKAMEKEKHYPVRDTGGIDFSFSQELSYKYCTELILKGKNLNSQELKRTLDSLGDSLLVVGNGSMLKIHIHSNNPGKVLEICLKEGDLTQVKIDNMAEQQEAVNQQNPYSSPVNNNRDIEVIAVSPGDGISDIFYSLGVSQVIEGGQTMNPSTEDFLQAVERADPSKVVLLPNNKNIILAAEQTRGLSQKDIEVVPSKTVPQGICALMTFNPLEIDLEKTAREMKESLNQVKTGQVTFAVRDSIHNDLSIKNGSVIGLRESNLEVVGENSSQVVLSLVERMLEENDEIITLYFGQGVYQEEAEKIKGELERLYPQVEVDCYRGGQPLYYYFISIE